MIEQLFGRLCGRTMRLAVTVLVATSAVVAGPSFADSQKDVGKRGSAHGECAWGDLKIDHGGGSGYFESKSAAMNDKSWDPCDGLSLHRSHPKGEIAVRQNLYKWNGATKKWEKCAGWDWKFNKEEASTTKLNWTAPRPWCGDGWYSMNGGSYVKIQGTWVGKWDGHNEWHWFPA